MKSEVRKKNQSVNGPIDDGYQELAETVETILKPLINDLSISNIPPYDNHDITNEIQIYCFKLELLEDRGYSTVYDESAYYFHYLVTFSGFENRSAARCCIRLISELKMIDRYIIDSQSFDSDMWQALKAKPQPCVSIKVLGKSKNAAHDKEIVREPHVINTQCIT